MRTFSTLVIVAAVGLGACARPAAPVTSPAPSAACPPAEAAVPAEDAAVRKWQAILADELRPPAGTTAAALVPELVAYLGSIDPVRRDTIAYDVLAGWIDKQLLDEAAVRALATALVANLRGPLDEPDGVYRRSFSALVLAAVVRRDAAAPVLRDDERRAILAAAHDYAAREPDLRGHTGARGWAHAAAHTADLLAQLAKLTVLTDAERGTMLDTVASFVVRRHGFVLADGEDGRLATAVIAAAKRGIQPAKLESWLAAIAAPLLERSTRVFDRGLYAAKRNARNLLFTLYVQTSLAAEPTNGERALLAAVRAVLAG